MLLLTRRPARTLLPWVVPILGVVGTFFAFLLVFVTSPFNTQPPPADGAGLNPSLQNPYMLAHPPLLYLGYVGLTIPFAFAMGALLARRTDELWIVATRRWTLLAWTFLGVGQLLGSHWAYVEIGWGGYYAWDPVENAALMPWLAATAFLHSVMIQEKRGMLKVWNVLLVIGAFLLSLFGTFLTRSGVLNSVHSFSFSSVGPWILGFIAFVTAASLLIVFSRLDMLRSRTRLESIVSREATFLYNNLLLVALCLTILWGVIFPIVSEAVRGETVTVGSPYFNFFLRVFGLPLLLLMGIGPLVAWRRASLRSLGRTFAWPAAVALATGVVLLFLGAGSSTPGLIGYTFSAFVLASIALEFARGTSARHATAQRELAARAHVADRAQPPALRRLHRARGDRAARGRHRRLERVRLEAHRDPAPGPVHGRGEVHADRRAAALHDGAEHRRGTDAHPGATRRRRARHAPPRPELLQGRGPDVARGLDPQRLPDRRGPVPERGHQQGRLGAPGGVREAARQPDLALRSRLHLRLGRRDVARRPRAAPARDPLRRAAGLRTGVTVALLLAAVLAIAAIVAVALPFIREPEVPEELDRLAGVDPAERRRLQLLEERDRALAALSELELDHRTGKVSDEDYADQVGPLRARAAAALRAIDSPACGPGLAGARRPGRRLFCRQFVSARG